MRRIMDASAISRVATLAAIGLGFAPKIDPFERDPMYQLRQIRDRVTTRRRRRGAPDIYALMDRAARLPTLPPAPPAPLTKRQRRRLRGRSKAARRQVRAWWA